MLTFVDGVKGTTTNTRYEYMTCGPLCLRFSRSGM